MRRAYAHEAILVMDDGADLDAPGGAITVALCGGWDHPPPCPLAPHHSRATRADGTVVVRTLFATTPDLEATVREQVGAALADGKQADPAGVVSRWRLVSSRRSDVEADEAAHAATLIRS